MSSLRESLSDDRAVLVPGVSNPLEAVLAAEAGFDVLYVTGYGVAAATLGVPDIGLMGLRDVAENVAAISSVCPAALVVDADTGYGDLAGVTYTVRRLERAGASAIQIEDQVWPKRCGHMEGKNVVSASDATRRIEAAVRARSSDETLIIARTDALAPLGFDSAIERAEAFLEVGADAVFIDAPQDARQLEQIPRLIPGPCVANMSESGKTPIRPFDELSDLGYKFVLYPTTAVRAAAFAVREAFASLKATGSSRAVADRLLTLEECNSALGLDRYREIEDELLRKHGHDLR